MKWVESPSVRLLTSVFSLSSLITWPTKLELCRMILDIDAYSRTCPRIRPSPWFVYWGRILEINYRCTRPRFYMVTLSWWRAQILNATNVGSYGMGRLWAPGSESNNGKTKLGLSLRRLYFTFCTVWNTHHSITDVYYHPIHPVSSADAFFATTLVGCCPSAARHGSPTALT